MFVYQSKTGINIYIINLKGIFKKGKLWKIKQYVI